jgi:hypothetical protein
MGIWGVAELLLAGLCWRGLTERDLSGAASLERMLWLGAGLDAGCIAVGATLAVAGWRMRRGLGLVGAGVGITLQGAALLALAMHFISTLARLTIAR